MYFIYLVEDAAGAYVLMLKDRLRRDDDGVRVTFLGSHTDETRALMLEEMFRQTVLPLAGRVPQSKKAPRGAFFPALG